MTINKNKNNIPREIITRYKHKYYNVIMLYECYCERYITHLKLWYVKFENVITNNPNWINSVRSIGRIPRPDQLILSIGDIEGTEIFGIIGIDKNDYLEKCIKITRKMSDEYYSVLKEVSKTINKILGKKSSGIFVGCKIESSIKADVGEFTAKADIRFETDQKIYIEGKELKGQLNLFKGTFLEPALKFGNANIQERDIKLGIKSKTVEFKVGKDYIEIKLPKILEIQQNKENIKIELAPIPAMPIRAMSSYNSGNAEILLGVVLEKTSKRLGKIKITVYMGIRTLSLMEALEITNNWINCIEYWLWRDLPDNKYTQKESGYNAQKYWYDLLQNLILDSKKYEKDQEFKKRPKAILFKSNLYDINNSK